MHALSDYDYDLPAKLIAAEPLPQRDRSRLLVVGRATGEIRHCQFFDLPSLLEPGDCLVLNDTRVIPARLFGRRRATGGRWEGLYLSTTETGLWRLIGETRGKLQPGERIVITPAHAPSSLAARSSRAASRDSPEEFTLKLIEKQPDGIWTAEKETEEETLSLLERFGTVPLPPYIKRRVAAEFDWSRYQTTYAGRPGAVAAPTAGLHFTPELLAACRERGIGQAYVTLHVGIGTFRPIAVEDLGEHRMHAEWCELTPETATRLKETRSKGGRIVAVGTTAVRTLETAARSGTVEAFRGETDLFIRPPYEFRAVDGLLTNFHLPKSSLLVLVSAFLGLERTKRVYECAVRERYRFYSYGDAMLVVE